MIRGIEFSGFVAVAVAVHAGLWAAAPVDGIVSGGAGGQARVSLEASQASIASLVEAWERPVRMIDTTQTPVRAPAPPAAPDKPARSAALEGLAVPRLDSPKQPPVQTTRATPAIDTAPPPEPAPAPQATTSEAQATRPVARPAEPQVARRSSPASAAMPRQRAAGQGGQSAQGAAGKADISARDEARRNSLMAEWGGHIRRNIERQKRYPRGTRATGTVHLSLTVSGDGRLAGVSVRQSSGDAQLDSAALRAVQTARLPGAPDGLGSGNHRFNLPISFSR